MILAMHRVLQKPGHCGPACVSMLLGERGVQISQEEIAQKAGLAASIRQYGSRVDQLASAVEGVTENLVLLARFNCEIADFECLIPRFRRPYGVEWQGAFRTLDGSTFEEGHYSVIHGYDTQSGTLSIADPDPRSCFSSGLIKLSEFSPRWWERNSIQNPQPMTVTNRGLAFVIASQYEVEEFAAIGFKRPTQRDLALHDMTGRI